MVLDTPVFFFILTRFKFIAGVMFTDKAFLNVAGIALIIR